MIMTTEQSTPISFIRAECTDLCNDGGSWSGNYCWVRRRLIVVPESASDKTVARRIKKALGIQGMPVDSWCRSDFSWRDGCVGAYADYQ